MLKLVQLFQNDNLTHVKNFARYVIEAFKKRNSLVNANTLNMKGYSLYCYEMYFCH